MCRERVVGEEEYGGSGGGGGDFQCVVRPRVYLRGNDTDAGGCWLTLHSRFLWTST